MNISNIDLVPPESKALSSKTDTEGTDLFSILMASITAGNGIQQGNHNVTADGGGPSLTGQVTFSTVDVSPTGQEASLVSPTSFPVESLTAKGLTAQDTSSFFTIHDIAEGGESNSGKTGADGILGELTNRSRSVDSLKSLVAGEVAKGLSRVVPYQTPEKTVNDEKGMELQLLGVAGPTEKAPTGDSVRLPEQVEKAKSVDLSDAKPLLTQAGIAVKEGDGVEVKESNVKPGTIVSGNDEGETVKGLDLADGIVPALGRESINPGFLHTSAKTFPENDPAIRNIQRPQIDPVNLVAQVSGKIKADFKSEGGEVRMELHPESLGNLKIEIKVEGGVVRASILTENAMVKDTIDSNLSVLKTSLEEHGLRIDQISVGVGHQHGGNAFAERRDIQIWQGFENADSSLYEGEEPVNESWYSVDSRQEQGVNIFA